MVTRNTFISTVGSIGIQDPNCVPAELDGNTYRGLSQVLTPPQCIAASDPGRLNMPSR